jgi:hypothetical protein
VQSAHQPETSVLAGAGVLIIGAVVWVIRYSRSSGQEA